MKVSMEDAIVIVEQGLVNTHAGRETQHPGSSSVLRPIQTKEKSAHL
jgi:hypothetical protein